MKKPNYINVTFILEFDKDSRMYASQIKEYPHVISQGKTQKEAMENAVDAFLEFVSMYKEKTVSRIKATQNRILKKSKILIHA